MASVSIVVPIHNAGSFLPRCFQLLRTLQEHTAHETEIVLIDDHSTDGSAALAKEWLPVLRGSRLLTARATGVARARNQALSECTGEFVWFTDADDEWHEGILNALVEAAVRTEADVVCCNATKIYPSGASTIIADGLASDDTLGSARAFTLHVFGGAIEGHLWNKLFRRAVLGKDPFPVTRAHSDLGGVLHVAPLIGRAAFVPTSLYDYRLRSGSILNSGAWEPTDLLECWKAAVAAASATHTDADVELVEFKYRTVVLPITSELARRGDARLLKWKIIDGMPEIRMIDIARLAKQRKWSLSARTLLLHVAPRAYGYAVRAAQGHRGRIVAVPNGDGEAARRAVTQ